MKHTGTARTSETVGGWASGRAPQGWGSTGMISDGRTDTNGKVLVNGVGEHLMPTAQMWRPLRPSSPVTAPDTRNSHTECGFALERVIARSGWFGSPSAAGPGARSRALGDGRRRPAVITEAEGYWQNPRRRPRDATPDGSPAAAMRAAVLGQLNRVGPGYWCGSLAAWAGTHIARASGWISAKRVVDSPTTSPSSW
jgi:hypothetical protein